MKKSVTFLLAALILSGPAGAVLLPGAGQAQAASAVLSVGVTGGAVTQLQSNLLSLGFFDYPSATGYYGSYTQAAVSEFQSSYALPVTGQADAITAEAVRRAVLKQSLVQDTYSYIGIPYIWGGATPSPGFDCSGFIYYMYSKFGVPQTRTTTVNLFKQGYTVYKSMLRPGDLVFFRIAGGTDVDHVGIYAGNGAFISATSSKGIYVQQLDNSYWGPRYAGARRIY
ncbi:C40 family peptidase [Paenibacillus rhizovicinus]|uniref:C40 family peptidase n=1 Tax=Paenibacillus rhizovicinus TaxID=2704463 RepID=A0A6C0P5W5_9BACL|nr:C40 family peptidase [Paenibacillus rhizovicinus]QHW32002.1 C40 family peptidase [Paenibacillus rhizovicinus]